MLYVIFRFPVEKLWTPEIMLQNGHTEEINSKQAAVVYNTGKIVFIPAWISKASCDVSMINLYVTIISMVVYCSRLMFSSFHLIHRYATTPSPSGLTVLKNKMLLLM